MESSLQCVRRQGQACNELAPAFSRTFFLHTVSTLHSHPRRSEALEDHREAVRRKGWSVVGFGILGRLSTSDLRWEKGLVPQV